MHDPAEGVFPVFTPKQSLRINYHDAVQIYQFICIIPSHISECIGTMIIDGTFVLYGPDDVDE